jgi:hypothetical protein
MRVAVVSHQAEQLALNNVAKPNGWRYFHGTSAEDLAVYDPEFLYVHGCFINDHGDWRLYQQLTGEAPKVVIRFTGTDALNVTGFVERGCTAIVTWLNQDRFLIIPPSEKVAEELRALGVNVVAPLNTPAQRVFDPIPRPKKFTIGVYMPPHRQDFFNIPKLTQVLYKMKDDEYRAIFYHFFPLMQEFGFDGPCELRFGLRRDQYEKTIADCSCLVRMPVHDANSISTAEFLMADRPVASINDFPRYPAMLNKKMTDDELAAVILSLKDAPPVNGEVREYCLSMYDPAKWQARLAKRCSQKWQGFKFDE